MGNIVVFDLETTGVDRNKDFIIQIAAIKVNENFKIIDELNQYVQPRGNYEIALGAYLKHKITPKFLADKPHFDEIAQKIVDFFKDCDILTYNGTSFDIPFLKQELIKSGYGNALDFTRMKCYDAFLEERRRNGIKLDDTYKRYKGKTMEEAGLTAHDALSDVKATFSIYVAQQRNFAYGPEELIGEDNVLSKMDFCGTDKVCFTIGKYRGISLEYVAKYDQGYLNWVLSDKCNFMESTKNYIKNFINS